MGRREARSGALPHRATSRIRSSCAASRRDVLPTCLTYGMGVIPWSPLAGGWLSGAFGPGKQNTSRRSAMLPDRYDLSLPGNQKKLEAVTELETVADDAGLTMIELALAFVLEHPAVTCTDHRSADNGAPRIATRRHRDRPRRSGP